MLKRSPIRNQKGLATIESVVLALVFVLLTSFGLGFYGIVQTGIVNSISARHYAFDTFQNRAHLLYHRDNPDFMESMASNPSYRIFGFRLHTITVEGAAQGEDEFIAPARNIAVTPAFNSVGDKSTSAHNRLLGPLPQTGVEREKVNPVWVKAAYGICLNATCGGG